MVDIYELIGVPYGDDKDYSSSKMDLEFLDEEEDDENDENDDE